MQSGGTQSGGGAGPWRLAGVLVGVWEGAVDGAVFVMRVSRATPCRVAGLRTA